MLVMVKDSEDTEFIYGYEIAIFLRVIEYYALIAIQLLGEKESVFALIKDRSYNSTFSQILQYLQVNAFGVTPNSLFLMDSVKVSITSLVASTFACDTAYSKNYYLSCWTINRFAICKSIVCSQTYCK